MAWYRLALGADALDGNRARRVAERLVGLEGAWRAAEDRSAWLGWDSTKVAEFSESLGTIGAGNHFAEIQIVGEVNDGSSRRDELAPPNDHSLTPEDLARTAPLQPNDVVLLVHSGSRGLGSDILKRYPETLERSSDKAASYLREHDAACDWAVANRDLIALRFIACLEQLNPEESVSEMRQAIKERKVVDILHNNMQMVTGKDDSEVWIHRKGAAPTRDPRSGQLLPLLPLPGSRATPTAILQPRWVDPFTELARDAQSVAHGAGRAMTRARALQSLSSKYKHDPQRLLIPQQGEGTWVVCEDKQLVWEEAPEAYKVVHAVAADLENAGLVDVLGWCQPRVSYKVRR